MTNNRMDFRLELINHPELKTKISEIVHWVANHETEFGKGPDFTKDLEDFNDSYEQDVLLSALEIFTGWNFYIRNNQLIGKCKFK